MQTTIEEIRLAFLGGEFGAAQELQETAVRVSNTRFTVITHAVPLVRQRIADMPGVFHATSSLTAALDRYPPGREHVSCQRVD